MRHLLCAEPLEGRCLLSTSAIYALPLTERGEVAIAEIDLPKEVVAALDARFPGAEHANAVLSDEEGESVYEVTTVFSGRTIEITLTRDGGIIEIEPLVSAPLVDNSQAFQNDSLIPEQAASASYSSQALKIPIEVIELSTPGTEGDEHTYIPIDELPNAVISTLSGRFPGLEFTRAELEVSDGRSEYAIYASFNGQGIEATVTADGEIVETERARAVSELPQAVLDWVEENFAGAEILQADEITSNGIVTYEVIVAHAGQETFEATLRLQDGSAVPNDSVVETAVPPVEGPIRTAQHAIAYAENDPNDAYAELGSEVDSASTEPSQPTAEIATDGEPGATAAGFGREVGPAVTTGGIASTGNLAMNNAIASLAAGSHTIVSLPQLAGVLHDVMPIDLAIIDEKLQAIVQQLDGAVSKVVSGSNSHSVSFGFAATVGVIAGTHLIVRHSRKSRVGPAIVFSASNSSWSWVVGSTPNRLDTDRRGGARTGDRNER